MLGKVQLQLAGLAGAGGAGVGGGSVGGARAHLVHVEQPLAKGVAGGLQGGGGGWNGLRVGWKGPGWSDLSVRAGHKTATNMHNGGVATGGLLCTGRAGSLFQLAHSTWALVDSGCRAHHKDHAVVHKVGQAGEHGGLQQGGHWSEISSP